MPDPTKRIDCGRPGVNWRPICGTPIGCSFIDPATGLATPTDTYATSDDANITLNRLVLYCPGGLPPDNAAYLDASIREQVTRMLPTVAIGGSPGPNTLVQIETIMWASTAPDRNLPTVTVVGHQVHLKIAFARGNWDYGDGTTAQRTTPGNAYPTAGICDTAICTNYDGHVYTKGGPVTIHLTVTWNASYSLDGHTYQPVQGGPITGPAATLSYLVRTAHAILVDH